MAFPEPSTRRWPCNVRLLLLVFLAMAGLLAAGFARLHIDYDIVRSLPVDDPVLADALAIFRNHPMHDRVAIDLKVRGADRDHLAAVGDFVEQRLRASGLFREVGLGELGELLPELSRNLVKRLPLLFTAGELRKKVLPLLAPERIEQRVKKLHDALAGLGGIGQASFIAADPLGLKNLVMARMALLAPTREGRIYRGHLISADGTHLLVSALPVKASTDTAFARRLETFFQHLERQLQAKYGRHGTPVIMTPVGAYRAALDNERIIRRDVRFATLLSIVGIALLLLLAFPRPWIGLLSLVPAFAGMAAAFFAYSFIHRSISIMVLGFGGAVISITVDHGIAYLLFLDRPHETRGKEASREVWAVGLMAVLTTVGAFAALCFSGFPILAQLGLFTALGVFFSFLFVHTIFPLIFPVMPAGSARTLPLQKIADFCARAGWPGLLAAGALAFFLLFHANPGYDVRLSAMNTTSQKTEAADQAFTKVWGDLSHRVYLMAGARSVGGLQKTGDRLLPMLDADVRSGVLKSFFAPALVYPGPQGSARNWAAWRAFWRSRAAACRKNLRRAARTAGFTVDAFAPFLALLSPTAAPPAPAAIPARYFEFLGISPKAGHSGLLQFLTLVPGPAYRPLAFRHRYGSLGRLFDPGYFSKRLGRLLFRTFTKMLLIVGISALVMISLLFMSWTLTLLTLLPLLFAYICTLGTMQLIGHPLDIPGLMLSIVILGMGIDYSIFFVRAYQRYREPSHPSLGLVRLSAFMAAATTLIGFGCLCTADHSLLRSAGLTSFLGIAYSVLGAFLILPPLLQRLYRQPQGAAVGGMGGMRQRVRAHYRFLDAYPRLFAFFKLRLDPLFADLEDIVKECPRVARIIDIGSGYGVPAVWLLEYFPGARLAGIEPDPERVRIANLALGERGLIHRDWAPSVPPCEAPAELAVALDMLHYLDDEAIALLFSIIRRCLASGGLLVIRVAIPPADRPSWLWRLESLRWRATGTRVWHRSSRQVAELLRGAGFTVTHNRISRDNPELTWLVGRNDGGQHGIG